MHGQLDELVRLRLSHTLLYSPPERVETLVQRVGHPGAVQYVLILGLQDQAQLPRFQRHPATQNPATTQQHRIVLLVGRGVHHHRPAGMPPDVPLAELVIQHCHLLEPRLQQIPTPQTGRAAARRNPNLHVEPVALLDTGPEHSPDHNQRRIGRGQHAVRFVYAPGLHLGQHRGMLRRRRWIAPRARQTCHQPHLLHLCREHPERNRHVAHQANLRPGRLRIVGALRTRVQHVPARTPRKQYHTATQRQASSPGDRASHACIHSLQCPAAMTRANLPPHGHGCQAATAGQADRQQTPTEKWDRRVAGLFGKGSSGPDDSYFARAGQDE